jgi:hypothetical protein
MAIGQRELVDSDGGSVLMTLWAQLLPMVGVTFDARSSHDAAE